METDAPGLYLITPPIPDWTPYGALFEKVIPACGLACLLIRTAASDEAGKAYILGALIPLAQEHGVACLVEDDPQLAILVNADGVHVNGEGPLLESSVRLLKPGRIAGAGGLRTRHAAMAAGEAGADYVLFGGSGEPHANIAGRVSWWAELFTVPCVGYAHDLGSIGDLVRAGADFIALGDAVFADPRGAKAALCEAQMRINETAGPAR
ncbi:MAG: thiamine phosphate synthase [Beijerinckiaceae bacterium]|nr:thiamine phosphate synthase [Beijerinckiaceae bacterium]